MITVYILGVFILLLCLYYHAISSYTFAEKMFPGPMRIPLLGNLYLLITTREGLLKKVVEFPARFNYKTFYLWFSYKFYLLSQDPETIQVLSNSPQLFSKPQDYQFMKPWLGEGLLTAPASKWKVNRKLMNPAFHISILHTLPEIFYKNSIILRKKFLDQDGKGVFDMHGKYNHLYALDNLCETTMGTSIGAQLDPESEYLKAVSNLQQVILKRLLEAWYRSDFIFRMSKWYRIQEESLKVVHKFTSDVIQKRKEERKKMVENGVRRQDEENESKKRNLFLDVVLDAAEEGNWSDSEIRSEVDMLVFAGHDTVATTFDFLFYNLAEHQDVQEKVCEELKSIFGDEDRCPTYQELKSMKYTERVIKESLRMYPPVPVIGRHSADDVPLDTGGEKFVPKGIDVGINIVGIHHNPTIYENPHVFDPDRWTIENMEKRHPYAFIPFSAGPRNCIGQNFAMIELKVTLASILRKVHFLPPKPEDRPRPIASMILVSQNGINVKVKARPTPYGI